MASERKEALKHKCPTIPKRVSAEGKLKAQAKLEAEIEKHIQKYKSNKYTVERRVFPSGKTLVLGMAFVTPAGARQACRGTKQGTTSATYRDFKRLRSLETNLGFQNQAVGISMGALDTGAAETKDDQNIMEKSKYWDKHKFLHAFVGESAVAQLLERRTDFGLASSFRYIMGDYIRFPADYLRQFYISFIDGMLFPMIRAGLIDATTQIILPHAREQSQDRMYKKIFDPKFPADVSYIWAEDFPLYAATEPSFLNASILGGSSNHNYVYGSSKDPCSRTQGALYGDSISRKNDC